MTKVEKYFGDFKKMDYTFFQMSSRLEKKVKKSKPTRKIKWQKKKPEQN